MADRSPFRARSQASLKATIADRELVFRPISAMQALRLGPVIEPVMELIGALRAKAPAAEATAALTRALLEHPLLTGAVVLDSLRDMQLEGMHPGKVQDVDAFLAGVDAVVLAELLAAVVTVNLMGSVPFAQSLAELLGQAQGVITAPAPST